MDLSEQIVAALREKYRSGATFAELAKSSGVSLTYLRSLTVGERDPMKMSLDFFLRLFPSARIELAHARVPDDPAAAAAVDLSDYVPKSDYAALRDQYQDLRDRYQDLREQYIDLKERAGARDFRERKPESTLSPSN